MNYLKYILILLLAVASVSGAVEKRGAIRKAWDWLPFTPDATRQYQTVLPNGESIRFSEKETQALADMPAESAVGFVDYRKRATAPALYLTDKLIAGELLANDADRTDVLVPQASEAPIASGVQLSDIALIIAAMNTPGNPTEPLVVHTATNVTTYVLCGIILLLALLALWQYHRAAMAAVIAELTWQKTIQ